MHKLPVILDTGAGFKVLRENQLTSFLKTQAVHVSETTKIHIGNDKFLRIVSSIKLFVHVDRKNNLVSFLVCERLAAPAILGCDFYDQIRESIYVRTR